MVLGSFWDGGDRSEAEIQSYAEILLPGKITAMKDNN